MVPTPWSHMHFNIAVGISEESALIFVLHFSFFVFSVSFLSLFATNDIVRMLRAGLWIQAVFRIFIYFEKEKNCDTDHERRGKTMQYEYKINAPHTHTRNVHHSNPVQRHTMAIRPSTYFLPNKWQIIHGERIFHTNRWCRWCHTIFVRCILDFAHGAYEHEKFHPNSRQIRIRKQRSKIILITVI